MTKQVDEDKPITADERKIVYLVYNYYEGKDGFWNPILYADHALAEADSESRGKEFRRMKDNVENKWGVRILYLDQPIGEYKSAIDYYVEEYADNIIVSIKVRLGELDLEIHDARNNLHKAYQFSEFSYNVWRRDALIKEQETLEKIMRGEYGRG